MLISLIGWLVTGLFHLTRWLPERLTAAISVPLGGLIRKGMKRQIRGQAERALGPFAADADAARFWKRHLDHLGRCIFEGFHLTWLSDDTLRERIEVIGEEHLREALAGGKGAVLFLNHLGNPGALVASFGLSGYPTAFAGNRIELGADGRMHCLDRVEALVQRMYRRGRVERVLLGEGLPRRMAEILKGNGLFGLFMDYPVVWKNLVQIPFGGCDIKLNLGPAILALRHRVPVLAVTVLRTGLNHHRVIITPIKAAEGSRGTAAATSLMTAAIGQLLTQLRPFPEQWWPWDYAPFTPSKPDEH
jgi:lauroyl/myristoyl acyltransferase